MLISQISVKGKYYKNIELVTNDPEKKEITLTLEANILETLAILPSYINFEQLQTGTSAIREITLRNSSKERITINQIIPSNPQQILLNAKAPLHLKPGETRRLQLTLKSGKVPQYFAGAVQFIVQQPQAPLEKTVVIRAEVVGGQETPR